LLVALALVAGCGNDACTGLGGSCIALMVAGSGSVDTLQVVLSGAASGTRVAPSDATIGRLPVDVAVQIAAFRGGTVEIVVVGYLGTQPVGQGATSVHLNSDDHVSARVQLDAGASFDLAVPADLTVVGDLAPCNVVAQSCGPGEKCTLSPSQGTCEPDGTKSPGQGCGPSTDDCLHGNECTTERQCRAYCNSDADCKQPPVAAGPTAEPKNIPRCLFTTSSPTAKLCTVPCNPVTAAGATSCAGSLACEAFGNGSNGILEATDCEPPGAGSNGATCVTNGDCAAGFGCFTFNGRSLCRLVCRAGNSADCSALAGYQCRVVTNWTMFGDCCPAAGC
jgi:hypothetical protein